MQQLMYSFSGSTPPKAILDGVRDGSISSFCLFEHWNVDSTAQLRALNEALLRAAAEGNQPPPLIGIDQEGGQLIPITHGATELPGNMALGATRDPALAEQAGRVMARELRALGINVNFAPSLDVNINPANPVVGTRSFSADPQIVATLGTAMIKGLQDEGVIATVKHFPGHGDTSTDSHHTSPVVAHDRTRIDAVELLPFRAAIAAGVQAVMPAHILFTELDTELPATLSRAILTDFLRGTLGFNGLLITDAMDMYAVARFGAAESVTMTLQAGVDLALLAHLEDQFAIRDQVAHLSNPAALARIRAARDAVPRDLPPFDVVGSAEHQQIAQTIADRSITLVRDTHVRLPLRPAADDTILVITPEPADLTPADTSSLATIRLADAIRQRHPQTRALELPHNASESDISAVLREAQSADCVIVGTISADQQPDQAALVQALHKQGNAPVVVALRTPYDLIAFPQVDTYLCAYSIRAVTTEAVARVLFGEIEPRGVLPCPIPGIADVITDSAR